LPATVFVLRHAWRGLPAGLRETARGLGATRWQATWLGIVLPALPGLRRGLLVAFVLALGLAPLLAPPAATP
jgi:ABC-type spermidine/putrescine transport system permease subunit I